LKEPRHLVLTSRLALSATTQLIQMLPRALSAELRLTTHLRVIPKSGNYGYLCPLPDVMLVLCLGRGTTLRLP